MPPQFFAQLLRSSCCVLFLFVAISQQIQAVSQQPAKTQGPLQILTTVIIPNTPSKWCYDTAIVHNNTYYLADNDHAGIDVIRDGHHPTYQGTIGSGQFIGVGGCKAGNYNAEGPEGLVIAHNQIFGGDGNSSVRIYSLNGQFITKISTHGHLRADEMTYDAHDQLVVVANSSERDYSSKTPPFLSFISTKPGRAFDTIIKTLYFPHADAIEQPTWNPYDSKLYVTLPGSDQNPTGEVDKINPHTWKISPITTPNCVDAGLAFANPTIAAVGCANGDQIILNVQTHHISHIPITTVDIVAATNHLLFYASYGSSTQAPQLAVADLRGHLLQSIPLYTTMSHTVSVNPENNHIYVPLDAGHIEVFKEVQQPDRHEQTRAMSTNTTQTA